MKTYTIELSAAEDAALSCVTLSQKEWINNAVHERARIAIDDIVSVTVQKCLDTNTQIPGSKEEMVSLALERGWVKTAAEVKAEYEETEAARLAEQQTAAE